MFYNNFFISCTHEEIETSLIADHTLIVYMAADNDLYTNALQDTNEMLQCNIPQNCNVVIYLDAPAYSSDSIPKISIIKDNKLFKIEHFK